MASRISGIANFKKRHESQPSSPAEYKVSRSECDFAICDAACYMEYDGDGKSDFADLNRHSEAESMWRACLHPRMGSCLKTEDIHNGHGSCL